jgi:Xaa-Pro aminopeptidase
VTDLLIFAATVRSPELRHEVPIAAPDAMTYLEHDGTRRVYVSSFELPRLRQLEGLEPIAYEELGLDELISAGYGWHEIDRELVLRACRHAGARAPIVPRSFPLDVADHLRENGLDVWADGALFDARRRRKTPSELAGIRRALRASERAYDRVRELLCEGRELSSEGLRAKITRTLADAGMTPPELVIVSHGAQTAVAHEPGHGRIEPGEPIVVDLYPQDPESGCYSDMTRTFCVGDPPEQLVAYHQLCLEVLDRVYAAIRPGVNGEEIFGLACDVFEREARRPRERCSAKASTTRSATESGSRSTSRRCSAGAAKSWSPATSSRWSPASTRRSSAASASRISSSSPTTAASASRTTPTTWRRAPSRPSSP